MLRNGISSIDTDAAPPAELTSVLTKSITSRLKLSGAFSDLRHSSSQLGVATGSVPTEWGVGFRAKGLESSQRAKVNHGIRLRDLKVVFEIG